MKISKVDHTRVGVSVPFKNEKPGNQKGVLYYSPEEVLDGGKRITFANLERQIRVCNEKAQGLYAVLVEDYSYADSDAEIKKLRIYSKNFNIILKNLMQFCKEPTVEDAIAKQVTFLNSFETQTLYDKPSAKKFKNQIPREKLTVWGNKDFPYEEMVQKLVQNSTKSSLRTMVPVGKEQVYLPDLIAKLMLAVLSKDRFSSYYKQITKDELHACLEAIDKDYRKDEQLSQIRSSIEHQNVKVKVVSQESRTLLVPTYSDHEKKHFIFDFMKAYADAPKDGAFGQNAMLADMRLLLILLICGRNEYERAAEGELATAWSFGIFEKKDPRCFSNDIRMLIENSVNAKGNAERKKYRTKIEESLKKKIADHYFAAIDVLMEKHRIPVQDENGNKLPFDHKTMFGISDLFWLDYFEKETFDLLNPSLNMNYNMLSLSWICEKLWQRWTAFIATKFIDYGKAVYHFAIPDLSVIASGATKEQPLFIGQVGKDFTRGISGFEYERIKAEDTLEREISKHMIFAINNFSDCVAKKENMNEKETDVLTWNFAKIEKDRLVRSDASARILRYFGGKSTWKGCSFIPAGAEMDQNAKFCSAIKDELYRIRNATFHYAGTLKEEGNADPVILQMFEKEYQEVGKLFGKKYYSNNVWMFYTDSQIRDFTGELYKRRPDRPAQIPSFSNVMGKKEYRKYVPEFFKESREYQALDARLTTEERGKLLSSLYFVLKEIYYYAFLSQPDADLRKALFDALSVLEKEYKSDRKRSYAIEDFQKFKKRLDPSLTFGGICQAYMTEFMLQNNEGRKVLAGDKPQMGPDAEIYEHYKLILFDAIRKAFKEYLSKDAWKVLKQPGYHFDKEEPVKEEEFCANWDVNCFASVASSVKEKPELYSWYTAAHFMHPKQLNHLIGSIRNYIQFTENIEKRASSLKNRYIRNIRQKTDRYRDIVRMLEFAQLYVGKISHEPSDYFGLEDPDHAGLAYAKILKKYVAFEDSGMDDLTALKVFCDNETPEGSRNDKIRLYHDPEQIILKRNVVFADMYGSPVCIPAVMEKDRITLKEIQQYYRLQNQLETVFQKNEEKNTVEDQKKLRQFQNLKNRIELHDAAQATDIVNELIGNLVSWAYLRERDKMFFQLGFYYTKLFFTDSVEPDSRMRALSGNIVRKINETKETVGALNISEGAILYQIIAMYTYAFQVIQVSEEGAVTLELRDGSMLSTSEENFKKKYMRDGGAALQAGMEFFERTNEKKGITDVRNYIDHFRYYTHPSLSLLDLYSEMYDRFFSYDMKLKKNVSTSLKNALMRYNIDLHTKKVSSEQNIVMENGKGKTRKTARYAVAMKGLISTQYTYKCRNEKGEEVPIKLPVHEKNFLQQIRQILEYTG